MHFSHGRCACMDAHSHVCSVSAIVQASSETQFSGKGTFVLQLQGTGQPHNVAVTRGLTL